ncbi:MAG TPA: glycoside hydrolase family 15 protein [Thermoanaerobaculia bacterium]|nr:glycoside hydrolase family 15 protein [Thermoanaerobaculia bacterium]
MRSLDLALIGNGTIGCLVDRLTEMVWTCFPRFDGDPMFCSLLGDDAPENPEGRNEAFGFCVVDLLDRVREEQEYLVNTPILVTRLYDQTGGCIEVTDFAPRYWQFGRLFCPMMLIRQIKRIAGSPRIRLRVRPACDYGRSRAGTTTGSNHIRFIGTDLVLRMTTDVPITAVLEETAFFLDDTLTLLLGSDETIQGEVAQVGRNFYEETVTYWREWVRPLGIPFEWQDAVIRAAITLKLNVFEDTGSAIAAVTTSIPEAPGSGRNWDYRHCWLRDSYFVVNALNGLGATRTMERYLGYIFNIVAEAKDGHLQPVYGISGRSAIEERIVDSLPGYRGMGPVRVGNQAYRQVQHDVYGSTILAATHVFFDRRLSRRGDEALFRSIEPLGERAAILFDQPDAGLWELRGTTRIHTFSSMMCWAGCEMLARIATRLRLADRAAYWRGHAARIHEVICRRSWNAKLGTFVATMEGDTLDASLLRLNEMGFLPADDPRFIGTVHAIERDLRHGDFIFRYAEKDDFGSPENAFLVCTFWYINALAALGRRDEARALFETMLACRNQHGLLSEDIDPRSREQWGNFVQTYSMVGLIAAASRLSIPWDQAY